MRKRNYREITSEILDVLKNSKKSLDRVFPIDGSDDDLSVRLEDNIGEAKRVGLEERFSDCKTFSN